MLPSSFKIKRRKMVAKFVLAALSTVLLVVLFFGAIVLGVSECTHKVSEELSKDDVQTGIATGVVETKEFFRGIGEKIKDMEEKK